VEELEINKHSTGGKKKQRENEEDDCHSGRSSSAANDAADTSTANVENQLPSGSNDSRVNYAHNLFSIINKKSRFGGGLV
jgi:hypothetical protein